MRIGMIVDYSGGFTETAAAIGDFEAAGLELIAVAEAYSFDAVSALGYLAARTEKMELASAILQVYSRTPALMAMTAAGLDHVSGGRFTLGIGASGPQVVEGFHGLPYDAPIGRVRETIEICRKVWAREVLVHEGKNYTVPLPPDQGTGLGKPLKLINHPVRSRIPVSVAGLGPTTVALIAEHAESWQPLFFHPGRAADVWGEPLAKGLAKRDPELGPLDIMLQVPFFLGEPDEAAVQRVRDMLALYVGGMGAKDKNFYNQLACRYGFEEEAAEIQRLYLGGQKAEAAAAVPQDLVDGISLMGTAEAISAKIDAFEAAGVTTFLLVPMVGDTATQVEHVRALAAIEAVRRAR
ncbi:LLM class F420-dependent oxidoreductase [Nocardioides stalactiti]|uniref:LLM class F420-dependent oxidoreductase n=1 Tax=Nocardioides stalactiti TaxID=2755356 RepID=UPI0015FED7F8|nr:LLM class F420-dependent oxidoreductase [Nocardioides stalactiti]